MRHSLLALSLLLAPIAAASTDPLLVVLTETGQERDGLPVLVPHPDGERIAAQLDRGVSGELLRVYRLLQIPKGKSVEPAYLLLSSRQGGFARYGFWLGNEKKSDGAYVDVHRDWEISGRFGAIDQIFPHELAHAILHSLGIDPPESGGANQIHAVAVRTDRYTAFNEGFAEHFQVMAVDHPKAAPDTRTLANAGDLDAAARRHLAAYRRELTARFAPATRMRLGFPLWYSNDERVLRYFAVKRNEFSREPSIPERLLVRRDRIDAYHLENTFPGDAGGAVKPIGRLLVSEGALSTLFHRWATNGDLQQSHPDAAFYEHFGTTPDRVTPLQNVYLKLFHAMDVRKPRDAHALVAAYREIFAEEAAMLDAVVSEAFQGWSTSVVPELWLANPDFSTGTTIFDQFRGAPRVHTFDLNAASIVDLTSVPGVSPRLARAIVESGPYASVDDLARVAGMSAELVASMRAMAAEMAKVRAMNEEDLSMKAILLPYVLRVSMAVLLAAAAGACAYRFVRAGARPSMIRTIISGVAAAVAGLMASWLTGNALAAIAVVVVLFGVPSALWQLRQARRLAPMLDALGTWTAAALPAAILSTAWFS